jgi:hypothetical protein
MRPQVVAEIKVNDIGGHIPASDPLSVEENVFFQRISRHKA